MTAETRLLGGRDCPKRRESYSFASHSSKWDNNFTKSLSALWVHPLCRHFVEMLVGCLKGCVVYKLEMRS